MGVNTVHGTHGVNTKRGSSVRVRRDRVADRIGGAMPRSDEPCWAGDMITPMVGWLLVTVAG